MENIFLLITIIKKSESEEFIDFFLERHAHPIYSTLCEGSTRESKLKTFGLEKNEKILMESLVTESKMRELIYDLTHTKQLYLPDRGIAMAIPLSSIASRKVLESINSENVCDENSKKKGINERTNTMELIVAICAKGHTNEIMTVAREAGATGGTIVKAKGTAKAGTDKFFGMAISDEKELVYIVSQKETKSGIMKAIASYTYDESAHPVVFSLPITETAGFRFSVEE